MSTFQRVVWRTISVKKSSVSLDSFQFFFSNPLVSGLFGYRMFVWFQLTISNFTFDNMHGGHSTGAGVVAKLKDKFHQRKGFDV